MTVTIAQLGNVVFFQRGNLTLDIGVRVDRGYEIYAREKRDESRDYEIAHKLRHVIGRRLVLAPKHEGQITEAALLAEIEAAL